MQAKIQMQTKSTASFSGRMVSAPCKAARPSRSTTSVVRAEVEKKAGVNVKATKHIAVGGLENPGSPEVFAQIDSGGRLPNGKKKTVGGCQSDSIEILSNFRPCHQAIITGASSGLGLHTAKVLVKTGDWNVICAGEQPQDHSILIDALNA